MVGWLAGWLAVRLAVYSKLEGRREKLGGLQDQGQSSHSCAGCRGPRVVIKIPGLRSREGISQCKERRCRRSKAEGTAKEVKTRGRKREGEWEGEGAAGLRSTFSAA